MFRRLASESRQPVMVIIDGVVVEADARDSVAAALLRYGAPAVQSNKASGQPRGPYCMMGVCFECLVNIDGRKDQQACMLLVRPGMQITTQMVTADVSAP